MSPIGMTVREFFINLAADMAAAALSPADMIGYLIALMFAVGWIANWHHKRAASGRSGVDSWYFIALALIIAAVSIAGASYGLGLRTSGMTRASNGLASALPGANAQSGSVLLSSRYYSSKNKEEVALRLDSISDAINKIGSDVLERAEILLNRSPWDRPGEDVAPYIQKMDELNELTRQLHVALYTELVDKERDYRVEMNAILFPKEDFIHFQVAGNGFRNALSVWMKMRDSGDSASRNGLLTLVQSSRMTFGEARDKFVAWLSKRQELINQTRRGLRS